jgi:stearoyl-CoA desaturase (Delta-9 desaturase)
MTMPAVHETVEKEVAVVVRPIPLAADHEPIFQWSQMTLTLASIALVAAHMYFCGWQSGSVLAFIALSFLTGVGVTVGYHRLFTHRSFETTRPIQLLLAVLGSMAGLGFFFNWVSAHRQHHQFSDAAGDPHSPNVHTNTRWSRLLAFSRAHGGWMLFDRMSQDRMRYIPDLAGDPTLRLIQRLQLLWIGLGLLLPALFCYAISPTLEAATAGLLWGGLLRIAVTSQITFCVNSVCHLWGPKPFEARDESRNNFWVAMFALGEGWHNNHHAFPTSARHGLLPGQFDGSYVIIRILARVGLAWNVKLPTEEQMRAKRIAA